LIDEEPIVADATSLAGVAVRLAWISGSDEMNAATPWSTVEGGKVRPDRRRIQLARFHARDKEAGSIGFPLHVSDGAMSGFSDGHAEPKSSDACAKFDAVPGTYSHVTSRSRRKKLGRGRRGPL